MDTNCLGTDVWNTEQGSFSKRKNETAGKQGKLFATVFNISEKVVVDTLSNYAYSKQDW